ncbi:hypothetical protein TNCV_139021 [Trichonephila clavipes]|nr:hypothetical protein TNCV_139021 [Trichonephila clavipes]
MRFWHRTATAGSDVVNLDVGFSMTFQHLWPYIGNNTANVVFQMVKRLLLIRIDMSMTLHGPTENSLAVLNLYKILGQLQVQNVK